MKTLAIDIGGTKFSVAAFDGDQLLRRESRSTDREGGRAWLIPQLDALLAEWKRDIQFDRCGIGFGGPVNFLTQTIWQSTHAGGWEGFPLTRHIADSLGAPVVMDNDANVGALGEFEFGAGKGCSPLFYMTISTGIGGGIVMDGKIFRGANGWAGEIGHHTLVPDGPDCLCGARGCFERMCCGLWMERDFGRSARELLQDPAFVKRYVVLLAQGLKTCIMVLNPARIVIGGGLSKAGDRLFVPLREELGRQITAWSGARQDVQPAALGDDSVLYGAFALARAFARST